MNSAYCAGRKGHLRIWHMTNGVQFGLGLVSLGRVWGHVKQPLPTPEQACQFLHIAVEAGVRFFDTAPSYGESEALFGKYLNTLAPRALRRLNISTKCGEHWDAERGEPYVDHSYDALCRSIDLSLQRLPKIDLLQLHRPTPDILRRRDVQRALAYARSCHVRAIGASVSDLVSARLVAGSELYSHLQCPYNEANQHFSPVFALARRYGKQLLINRPLWMGQHLYRDDGTFRGRSALLGAYRFILRQSFTGVILTGTRSAEHLLEDLEAFRQAWQESDMRGPTVRTEFK